MWFHDPNLEHYLKTTLIETLHLTISNKCSENNILVLGTYMLPQSKIGFEKTFSYDKLRLVFKFPSSETYATLLKDYLRYGLQTKMNF